MEDVLDAAARDVDRLFFLGEDPGVSEVIMPSSNMPTSTCPVVVTAGAEEGGGGKGELELSTDEAAATTCGVA